MSRIQTNEARWLFLADFDHFWSEDSFFEAAGALVKISLSLKPYLLRANWTNLSLSKSLIRTVIHTYISTYPHRRKHRHKHKHKHTSTDYIARLTFTHTFYLSAHFVFSSFRPICCLAGDLEICFVTSQHDELAAIVTFKLEKSNLWRHTKDDQYLWQMMHVLNW